MPVGLNPPPFATPDNAQAVASAASASGTTDAGDAFAALFVAAAAPLSSALLAVDDARSALPAVGRIAPGARGAATAMLAARDSDAAAPTAAPLRRADADHKDATASTDADGALALLRLLADANAPAPSAAIAPAELRVHPRAIAASTADSGASTIKTSSSATLAASATTTLAIAPATPPTTSADAKAPAAAATPEASLPALAARDKPELSPRTFDTHAAMPSPAISPDTVAKLLPDTPAAPAPRETLGAELVATSSTAFASVLNAPSVAHAEKVVIDTQVTSPQWGADAAETIGQLVLLRTDRADIQLHPAELGPIDVQIRYAGEQASVVISAAHETTKHALEQALPQLRELLAGQGIALADATVQSDSRSRDDRSLAWTRGSAATPTANGVARSEAIRVVPVRGNGVVDTFA